MFKQSRCDILEDNVCMGANFRVLDEITPGPKQFCRRRIYGWAMVLPSIVLHDAVFLTGSAGFACLMCELRGDACSHARNGF